MTKIITDEELEYISITSEMIDSAQPMVKNVGLSQALIDELSADSSKDGLICLLSLELAPDEWHNISSNPTEELGIDERGQPIYKTTFEGVDYIYLPFKLTLASNKASGELSSTQLRIMNTDPNISIKLENPQKAIRVRMKLISKINKELIQEMRNGKMTSIVNTIQEIIGSVVVSSNLNEQLPTARNYYF